jgi:hypothetical protein
MASLGRRVGAGVMEGLVKTGRYHRAARDRSDDAHYVDPAGGGREAEQKHGGHHDAQPRGSERQPWFLSRLSMIPPFKSNLVGSERPS